MKTIMTNWSQLIANGQVAFSSIRQAQALKIFPNRLAWVKDNPRLGAIAVFRGETDYAIGVSAVDYLSKAITERRIGEGHFLFLRRSLNGAKIELISALRLDEVQTKQCRSFRR